MNPDLGSFRLAMRGNMTTGTAAVRGGLASAPKKSFLAKGASPSVSTLRAQLDSLHAQIRGTTDATRLCDLVDEYVLVAAMIASSQPVATPFVPGGAVLSAAISAVGQLKSSQSPTGHAAGG